MYATLAFTTLLLMVAAIPSGIHHQHKRAVTEVPAGRGISYTPYLSTGQCKLADTVAQDLEKLKLYEVIRLYGLDCDQVASVLKAKGDNQKLFLELYDMLKIQDEVSTIASAVSSHGLWDDVYAISVGNELVNGGLATVAQVGEYVEAAKSALKSVSYNGPIVAVDTFIAVINNPGLCEFLDFMAVNAHAFFDGGFTAENAGDFVLEQIQRVWEACEGKKDVFISESGWPTKGESNGKAVPSAENQAAAILDIVSKCGNDTVLFSAYNDAWKQPGAYGVEQFWGMFD